MIVSISCALKICSSDSPVRHNIRSLVARIPTVQWLERAVLCCWQAGLGEDGDSGGEEEEEEEEEEK
jgi:hypothetical protein